MSQRPFGYGNRQGRWDSYSYERAGPRMTGPGEKQYRHPVIPVPSTSVPHYAQASQLYPMHTFSERDNIYRYRPGSGAFISGGRPTSPTSPTGLGNHSTSTTVTASNRSDSPIVTSIGSSSQAVVIPVLHLGSHSRTLGSSSPLTGGAGRDASEAGPNSVTTQQSDQMELGSRSPSFRTSSVVTNAGGGVGANVRTSITQRPLPTNDQEAEVDALTNILMQSLETKSSGIGSSLTSANSASPLVGTDAAIGSPAGSLRRGSGGQLGRLQQHIGLVSSSPTSSSQLLSGGNSGMNFSFNEAPVSTSTWSNHHHGSGTNSPTGSTSSLPNTATDLVGNSMTSSLLNQNSCFRCRRALIPPEGSTLSGGGGINGSNANAHLANVVTLTGALDVRLHVACFTCYRCAAPLRPDAYYHNLRRLLCPACVRDGAVETCSNCHRPIADRIVYALGMPYHPSCFVCVVCSNRLDSRPFTIDVHGRLHCLNDFHRRYAPRCTVCSRPIAPEPGSQEARRVVFGDSNYHLECFGVQTVTQPAGVSAKPGKLSASVAS